MKPLYFVALCHVLFVFQVAIGVTTPSGKNPIAYLGYFESAKEAEIDVEEARSEYLVSVENEKAQKRLYDLSERLYKNHSTSEENYKRALRNKEVSIARTQMWFHRTKKALAAVAYNGRQAEYAAGSSSDLDALYADYRARWLADCEADKYEIELLDAELRFATYRYDVGKRLLQAHAISEQKWVERDSEYQGAVARLQGRKERQAKCLKSLPELDFLKKFQN